MFARFGYRRDDVDALLVHEAAAILGVGEPDADAPNPNADLAGMSPGVARAIERMRAEAEGRPAPEPEAPDPSLVAFMQTGML